MKSWILYAIIFSIFFGITGFVVNVLSNFYIYSHLKSAVIFSGFLVMGVCISTLIRVTNDEAEESASYWNKPEPKYFRQAVNQSEK